MTVADFFPMWGKLTAQQQNTLALIATKREFRKGAVVHRGGECAGIFLIQSGQLRAYTISPEGREITIFRLFDQDICLFSASCMMRSILFDITIEAEKDTVAWAIPTEVYKGLLEESAPLANFTNEIMASRFSDVMWLMEQIMWKSFDKRLADFLLEESALEGTKVLRLTHEAIGNHMGNPREVVTRMLRYFQSEGMVRLSRGTVEILDPEKLDKVRSE